jgi:hypothetical protein
MRTIELLLFSQINSLDLLLVGGGKHVFVRGICLFHLPVEGRGGEHGFDGLERAAILESVWDTQGYVDNR